MLTLAGKKGLIVGIANEHSIATGCARLCHQAGADIAVTYLNEKARPYVQPVADEINASLFLPCDVRLEGQLESVFAQIADQWGGLDFLIHSIAYAPKEDLHGRITDCSAAGWLQAMDVSCHSFIRMANLAEPLMSSGGSLMTVSFYGAERVVEHYNLMGPVKAALESTVCYLAAELAPQHIRVNALSPSPIKTRAASGLDRFDTLLERIKEDTPAHQLATIDDVGAYAAFLASDLSPRVTGNVLYIDGGYHMMG